MEEYISKSVVLSEINKRIKKYTTINVGDCKELEAIYGAKCKALMEIISIINNLEVKEVNEVPATVMVNKYGNRFISSWSGLKEYDNFNEGEEIKILIPKK